MSVSRVGSSAQTKAMRHVASSLKLELASYHELLSFAQFSSDIDAATQFTIDHGRRLMQLLKQPAVSKMPQELMILSMFLNKYDYLDQLKVEDVLAFEKFMHSQFQSNHQDLLDRLMENWELDEALIADIKSVLDDLISGYNA